MEISPYRITSGNNFRLKNYFTEPPENSNDKKILKEQLQTDIEKIKSLQDLFFAHDRYALLMLFQGMDAAGKDGAIKHVMSGINPQGVQVVGFRAPSSLEYKHDFLWRHHLAMPERGKIGIHNRSHYEFVTTCQVHPEFVLKENLPNIKSVEDLNKKFWQKRLEQIKQFESMLTGNNLVMLKFYLHLSKGEQKKRLLERIDKPEKNWKFEMADLQAREQWDEYIQVYEQTIAKTATSSAPWYIIPADDKWFARALIAKILKKTLEGLNMRYPKLSAEGLAKLAEARTQILK
jgi:PPK2 family polyphosphate:nucleotide phosphotransferase